MFSPRLKAVRKLGARAVDQISLDLLLKDLASLEDEYSTHELHQRDCLDHHVPCEL